MGFYGEIKDLLKSKKGVLLDIDGVLLNNGNPIPGAREFVSFLKNLGKPFLCITNTTIKSKSEILKVLKNCGFEIEKENIITSVNVANNYLYKKYGDAPIAAYVSNSILEDLSSLNLKAKDPMAVLVGDVGEKFNREILNDIFNKLMNGADFFAFHKNRFWKVGEKLFLDLGGFISALEYSSGSNAKIIGKPSQIMFEESLKSIGLKSDDVLIIGDDYESDILGAEKVGIDGILVLTGKYSKRTLKIKNFLPKFLIKDLYELMD